MPAPRRYLAFDIETAKVLPEDLQDWRSHRPLGIACAATFAADSREPVLWYGGGRLSREETAALVQYLEGRAKEGYTLLTWNGLGFDLDVLAEESGMLDACQRLAMEHVDMMFHIFCCLGHPVGLDAAAKGMKVAGKAMGMTGMMAPVMWAEGKQEEVLRYVAQDVRTTLELARAGEAQGELRWVARSGQLRRLALGRGWLTAAEALRLPLPDTSWMASPWKRERFVGWMG